ncbi:MAG TPA: SMP-30/gluconolactonase/LRE family protein [Candidatus Paceibacterota bacterium]|nr:SMP-30/gluconolactonase/LRE family protein [Candidatus Paceibacterota bacterium]
MKVEIFDERRNVLGEGPNSSGVENEIINWVDVTGRKVRFRNMLTSEISEYETSDDVSFAIPRVGGGEIIGVADGPLLRDLDGTLHHLPTREDADGLKTSKKIRWNDAKVSPFGDLFLGTMAYDAELNAAAFYQLRRDGKHLRRLFGDVTCSNGMAWSADGRLMYYIDTQLNRVDIFDVEEREIRNRRSHVTFTQDMGLADGMSIDAHGNLWIAFWGGSRIRCIDGNTGQVLDEIPCPAPLITSCVFGGKDLDQLVITSASQSTDLRDFPQAGMVFIAQPGPRGRATTLFPT